MKFLLSLLLLSLRKTDFRVYIQAQALQITENQHFSVELVGVEPTSKQGNHTLSTRLFQLLFSCCSKTWTTNCNLIF